VTIYIPMFWVNVIKVLEVAFFLLVVYVALYKSGDARSP